MALLVSAAEVLDPAAAVERFAKAGLRVVTFAGFGELGYQDEAQVRRICEEELDRLSPSDAIINTGTLITQGFRRGITIVYELARSRGFMTTGVHPSVALTQPHRHDLAPGVDDVIFVSDATWGGFSPLGEVPSNTLTVLLAITDELIVVGGGEHTAQELRAFMRAGKVVRFHAAEMHHQVAERWSRDSGVRLPDRLGAAYHAWRQERGKDV